MQKQQIERSIYKIRDLNSKNTLHKQHEIQKTFKNYYELLYTQPHLKNAQQIEQFLDSINLPVVTEEQNKILTAEITETELVNAISNLKSNKSPVPDGFSSEWYKTFRSNLTPSLLQACNITIKEGKMPPSWNEAVISVLPKEGKDKLECGSYRPISILNVDYKLYTGILAKRLEKILPQLIHKDQTGFISQRQTYDNIRRSLHILNHIYQNKMEALLISLDAEKAFDSVNWSVLYKALERFGIHENFIKGIRTIYNKPVARIKINGYLTDTITLQRGTRQGCPISPLLFALYIEPLAQWIRQTKNIKGININGDIHKLALYADDILIYLSTPTTSLPELMTLLEKFGSYAGYKLNIQKTQTLSFKYTPPVTIKDKLNMKWDQKSLKYLGIHLTKEISTLAKVNYDPLLINIKNDIHRWNAVSFLSFSQRIDAIRVNVLPRYLYLFQALPTEIPQTHWSELNKTISRFIWQGKKPRIKLKAVELPKEQGGMALPYFKDYFYAAQTKYLVNLCNPTYQAKWKDIEITLMNDPPLQAILAHKNLGGYIEKTQNLWIKAQLKIWNIIKEEYKLNDKLQIIQWCAYDTEFKPNQMDYRFKSWISKGILTFYSLTEKGLLKDFESLKKEYNLDKSDFYRYLQLRNHFENNIKIKTDLDDSILKIFIDAYKGSGSKGIISKLYKGFRSIKPHSTEYVKEKWEKESNAIITVEEWLDICRFTSKCTNSHMWREFG